jgi:biopolymer transport protein ExbD
MKYAIEVCLIAITTGIFVASTAAQSPHMQKGISVELASTHNASPIANADREDAFVVTITAKGSTYLGANPITLPELAEKTRSTPFRRDQAVYVKADARSPYATVLSVLAITRTNGMIRQVLLTSQPESTQAPITPPEGLEVSVSSELPPGRIATAVEVLPSVEDHPLLKINNDETAWPALESTLRQHFQKGDDKVVVLKGDLRLPFAEIVDAIDACRAAGAKVYLAAPGN